MKTETKILIKRKLMSFVRIFALYGIMPMICMALIVLMATVNSFGAEEALSFAEEMGNKSLSAVLGFDYKKKEVLNGFYFLSDDFEFPLMTEKKIVNSGKSYYSKYEAPKKGSVHYDALPGDAVPVVKASLSSESYLLNQTNYEVNIDQLRTSPYPTETKNSGSDPLVLVIHTHGTESYLDTDNNLADFAPSGVDSYFVPSTMAFRTKDTSKNMIRIGEVFCDTLAKSGINVIHCKIMHDENDYNASYSLAAETIKEYLAKYPSIKYVIDLHRDAVVRGDSYVKSYAEINGKPTAQVMLVVGSNQNGKHPNWMNNLTVAVSYKDMMDGKYPNLCRPIYLRTARFNQEYTVGSMLLEIGTSANTLEESENAAVLAAESFADMLRTR